MLWSRTLELLDRAGCGEAFVAARAQGDGAANIIAGESRSPRRPRRPRQPYPYALMLPQSETERLMEAASAALGVQVERQVELTRFTADEDRRDGDAAAPRRREETVEAAWLIGCDGAHSTVRHGARHGVRGRYAAERLGSRRPPSRGLDAAGRAGDLLACGRRARVLPDLSGPLPRHRRRRRSRTGATRRPDAGRGAGDRRRRGPGRHTVVRPDLAVRLPHQRAQGGRLSRRAACSWPATPRISTARPAARA